MSFNKKYLELLTSHIIDGKPYLEKLYVDTIRQENDPHEQLVKNLYTACFYAIAKDNLTLSRWTLVKKDDTVEFLVKTYSKIDDYYMSEIDRIKAIEEYKNDVKISSRLEFKYIQKIPFFIENGNEITIYTTSGRSEYDMKD